MYLQSAEILSSEWLGIYLLTGLINTFPVHCCKDGISSYSFFIHTDTQISLQFIPDFSLLFKIYRKKQNANAAYLG